MKKILTVVIVVALGAGGYYYWNGSKKAKVSVQPVQRPTTADVASRNIHFVFTAAGDIGPADQVSVRPEINGKISVLPVDIGDAVKKGELLFALDDQDLQTERASRVTDIDGSKLTVEKTKRNFERSRRLYADHLISQEVYDDAKTDYDLAQNALDKADKALRSVDDQLAKTRIVAPFDCTVLTRPVSIGQAVSGTGGNTSGTEVMTIANLKDMIVAAHVNQADVVRMKNGQTVDIEVEAVPGLKFQGIVDRIAPQATIKNNIKGFATQILLKNIDPRVRPGMTANLSIPLASADNVLAIPLAAVFTEQGDRYVYVKTEDGFTVRAVRIGVADFQYAEVLEGLATGEVVSLVRPDKDEVEGDQPKSQLKDKKKKDAGKTESSTPAATNRVAETAKPASL